MHTYAGKVVLVTGSSSGIGSCIVEKLLLMHLSALVLVSLDEGREDCRSHETNTCRVLRYRLDLRDVMATNELKRDLSKQGLKVDVLVQCAGIGIAGSFHDLPEPLLHSMVDLNCRSLAHMTHAFLPDLLRHGEGGLLHVSSIQGEMIPIPLFSLYAATKAFVTSFTLSLHYEYEGKLKVICACPGPTSGTRFGTSAGIDVKSMKPFGIGLRIPAETAEGVAEACLLALLERRGPIVHTSAWTGASMWLLRWLPFSWLARWCKNAVSSSMHTTSDGHPTCLR